MMRDDGVLAVREHPGSAAGRGLVVVGLLFTR